MPPQPQLIDWEVSEALEITGGLVDRPGPLTSGGSPERRRHVAQTKATRKVAIKHPPEF